MMNVGGRSCVVTRPLNRRRIRHGEINPDMSGRFWPARFLEAATDEFLEYRAYQLFSDQRAYHACYS